MKCAIVDWYGQWEARVSGHEDMVVGPALTWAQLIHLIDPKISLGGGDFGRAFLIEEVAHTKVRSGGATLGGGGLFHPAMF